MVIDSKYRIDSLLGEGGMGKVFRVTHLQLDKTFALKLLHFNQLDTDPNRIMPWNRHMMLTALHGCYSNMTAGLSGDLIAGGFGGF